jgi:hypothetical protein
VNDLNCFQLGNIPTCLVENPDKDLLEHMPENVYRNSDTMQINTAEIPDKKREYQHGDSLTNYTSV